MLGWMRETSEHIQVCDRITNLPAARPSELFSIHFMPMALRTRIHQMLLAWLSK